MTEFGTAESWEEARKVAAVIGKPPSTFGTCIRTLINDNIHNAGNPGEISTFSLYRLFKSKNLQSTLYYAIKTYRPEELQKHRPITSDSLFKIFKLDELAYLLSILYLFRTIRKDCDAEEWKQWCTPFHGLMDIGGIVGQAIPAIGFTVGILTAGLRHMGGAMFLRLDKARFTKYRRNLKTRKIYFDLDEEMNTWGCTHVQIGSLLLQSLGTGVEMPNALAHGLLPSDTPDNAIPDLVLRTKVASTWIEALHVTGKLPDVVHRAKFYPTQEQAEFLVGIVKAVREKSSLYEWLNKNKDHVSPQNTPELFANTGPAQAEAMGAEGDTTETEVFEEPSEDAQQ